MTTLSPPQKPVQGSRESDAVNVLSVWMSWVESTLQNLEDSREVLAQTVAQHTTQIAALTNVIKSSGSITANERVTQAQYNALVSSGTVSATTEYLVIG